MDSLQTTLPDLTTFQSTGGKVLHYHGEQDPSVPAASSVHYWNSVRNIMYPGVSFNESVSEMSDWYRLFLVPGAAHCGAVSLLQTSAAISNNSNLCFSRTHTRPMVRSRILRSWLIQSSAGLRRILFRHDWMPLLEVVTKKAKLTSFALGLFAPCIVETLHHLAVYLTKILTILGSTTSLHSKYPSTEGEVSQLLRMQKHILGI